MSPSPTWPTLPADQLPRDPWPHERGEDPHHLLDPSGHVPHHRRASGAPARRAPTASSCNASAARPARLATYLIGSEIVAFVVVALLVLAGSLPGAAA